jgi:hypothetical protein
MTQIELEYAKLLVQAIGLLGTLVVAGIAMRTFRRTEKWKRAEFLASKMKEFFDDRRVQQAMTLVDWGSRRVQLLDGTAPNGGVVRATRALQARALLPHTMVDEGTGSDVEGDREEGVPMRRYTSEEAAVRDRYDSFLDGLERFAGYVESGLVDAAALRPYLGYWVDDIHAPTKDVDDAEWCAALLTYIHFYQYSGVQKLFAALDRDISPESTAYQGFIRQVRDRELAAKLASAAGLPVDATHRAG